MSRQGLIWCGEGDLFLGAALKRRKLYTSRRAKSSESTRKTKSSHTISHTPTAARLQLNPRSTGKTVSSIGPFLQLKRYDAAG